MMKTQKFTTLYLALLVTIGGMLACSFPSPDSGNGTEKPDATRTPNESISTPTETEEITAAPSTTSTPESTPTDSATLTATAPSGGVSLNCDGTYQRVRITDNGIAGKTISVDNWNGVDWDNVWNMASGDPNLRQLMPEAGTYEFGGCQKLVIVPMRSSGPHLWYELGIYAWNGVGLSQVYFNEGYYGEWEKAGDVITFREANTLGGSPLGPCEWMTLEHEWNGTDFVQTGSVLEPVVGCTPIVP